MYPQTSRLISFEGVKWQYLQRKEPSAAREKKKKNPPEAFKVVSRFTLASHFQKVFRREFPFNISDLRRVDKNRPRERYKEKSKRGEEQRGR